MILHLTTVHPRDDVRIWFKEVATVRKIQRTALVVDDGRGSLQRDGVSIYDVDSSAARRLTRFCKSSSRALRRVLELQPSLVHFHDPELLLVGFVLRSLGYRVIYDVHEDVPRQVLDKYWLPVALRWPISWMMSGLEWVAGRVLTAIVAATPTIAARFPRQKTITIQNFPHLDDFQPGPMPHINRPLHFVYTGALAQIRGAREMVTAVMFTENEQIRLQFAGTFRPASLEEDLSKITGWSRVDRHGWLSRSQIGELLAGARGGLVLLHPTRSYLDAYPIKMFEYMAAGLPVIASDFPLWRSIVEGSGCGLLVNPLDPQAIGRAMQWITENPAEAQRMGQRGRQAITELYNWGTESTKLIDLYSRLLG